MNAEQMELARRFVACKGWVWLPGMQAASKHDDERGCIPYRVIHVYRVGMLAFAGRVDALGEEEAYNIGLSECVPDLSDALTRAGLLEVVRRAWGNETVRFRCTDRGPLPSRWVWDAGDGRAKRAGWDESVLHALLAALEAAPGV